MSSTLQTGLILLSLLLVINTSAVQSSSPPGVKAIVTQAALQYAADTAFTQMTYRVHDKQLPDASGVNDFKIGTVKWQLHNIVVASVTVPASKVTLSQPSVLHIGASHAYLSLRADWAYQVYTGPLKILSDHGSLDMMTSNAGIVMTTSVGASKGQPVIRMTSCSGDIGILTVQFHGGAAWIYNLLKDIIWIPVKNSIQDILCKSAGSYIDNDGSEQLANLKLVLPIGDQLLLDYSLTSTPQITKGLLQANLQGVVHWKADPKDPPFTPEPLSTPTPAAMVTLVIGDYLLNSLSYAEYKHSGTVWNMTRKDLSNDPYLLNTTCDGSSFCLGDILVQVPAIYPNAFFELDMRTTKVPLYASLDGAAQVVFGGHIDFYARLQNGSRPYLFSAAGNATLLVTPRLNGSTIQGETKSFKIFSWVTRSAIGTVYNETVKFVGNAISKVLITELNRLGDHGFDLPIMKNISLVHPTLKFSKGMITVSSDLHYDGQLNILREKLKYKTNAMLGEKQEKLHDLMVQRLTKTRGAIKNTFMRGKKQENLYDLI